MRLFCKEQLEEIYRKNTSERTLETATHDENIDKIIYEKIDKGFEFTENLGYSPYYCESCKKIFSHFYFEMVKDDNIYVPDYICKKCSNVLGRVFPTWINKNKGIKLVNDDVCTKAHYKYNIYVYEKRNIIKIKSNKGEEKLVCENCGNDKFLLLNIYDFD